MKGLAPSVTALIIILFVIAAVAGTAGYFMLAAVRPSVPIPYDGEFKEGFIPTEGNFLMDFTEYADCNVTDDYLGTSDYAGCIYRSNVVINDTDKGNSTDLFYALAVDIDGPVQDLAVEADLQDTGTCKPSDDITIVWAQMWTHEDTPVKIADLTISDSNKIDGNTGPIRTKGEYVLYTKMRLGAISPNCVTGDDLMKIQLDLTTTGDVDAARILLESK